MSTPKKKRGGVRFVAWITTRDGKRIYAKDKGKRAFVIPIEPKSKKR